MSKSQREKGQRREREFSKLINGERIPLSGAAGGSFKGDVLGLGLTWEIKARRDGFKLLHGWLENADALALKADHKEWLVVMPLQQLQKLLQEK
jgi:hypothetical protein